MSFAATATPDPVWRHLLELNQPRQDRFATPGALAAAIDARTVQTPALDLIDAELARLLDTPDGRLIISMPPQEGKSVRVGRDFPIWALMRNPELRIVTGSYAQGLANRNGRAIRNALAATPETGLAIARDHGAVSEWTLQGHDGGVLSVGRGAGVTGRPADCVSGDMHIECEHGRLTAADAFSRGITRILAYDHTARRAVWRNVEAARRIDGRPVVEVVTESGRVLTCTPDHRVYTGRGYVPAGSLRHGDTLVAIVDADRMPMRDGMADPAGRDSESDHARPEPVLHQDMHGGNLRQGESGELVHMRWANPAQPQADLLRQVPAALAGAPGGDQGLHGVRARVSPQVQQDGLLLAGLREYRTLPPDDRARQLALQDRDKLRQVVPVNASVDHEERRELLCGLPASAGDSLHPQRATGSEVGTGDPSHRRGRAEQQFPEPHHPLPRLPYDAPQVTGDTVSVVRHRGGEAVSVYDFQVEGTNNFFAEGVLVHNCLIIDDPIKDRAEADSLTIRDTTWDWWTDALAARLAPGAPAVLIMTRWHEDDLAGRLVGRDAAAGWRVLNIPAQCEDPATDPLGREPGEYMISARRRTREQWEQRKRTAGSRTWAALYQGRPSPTEGGAFRRTWWRHWTHPPQLHRVIQSWDMAFKGTDKSDFVVGQVWATDGADSYLLDQVRGRWTFTETLAQVRLMRERWPMTTATLVEDKANGTAVIDSLSRSIPGLIPVEPQGGKETRAAAVSPLVEAGNVWLPPATVPWVGALVEEAAAFPQGSHDDQIDALSQALAYLHITQPNQKLGTGFFDIG